MLSIKTNKWYFYLGGLYSRARTCDACIVTKQASEQATHNHSLTVCKTLVSYRSKSATTHKYTHMTIQTHTLWYERLVSVQCMITSVIQVWLYLIRLEYIILTVVLNFNMLLNANWQIENAALCVLCIIAQNKNIVYNTKKFDFGIGNIQFVWLAIILIIARCGI